MKRSFCLTLAMLVLTFATADACRAQTTQPADLPQASEAMGVDAKQQMMQKWMELATPGPQHERLARRVGQWEHKVKAWCDPDPNAPPMETTGMTEVELILGGRFVMDHASGQFNGQPFEGIGLCGYDNLKKKYVSIWVDTMSTGMMISEGEGDEHGKVITYEGHYTDPMTASEKTVKTVETSIDENTWKMEMFEMRPDAGEVKTFEIVYTRKH